MERILALNIGGTQLAIAEFELRSGKAPTLLRYAFGAMPEGVDPTSEMFAVELETAVRMLLAQGGIRPGRIMVSLSGQMAFPRFVKVLADTPEKMQEQIRFEVEQNVPFPLDEAAWSEALIGAPDAGEQHVMIVATRKETVSAITRALLNVGMEPEIIDVAPVALYNAARFNYPDAEGCTLVIDIGAKCTNLVFVEGDRIFYRTIPVAGNTMTSEVAKTFGLSLAEAEMFKCESGIVAQGGAFAIDDPDVDRLSKVIRNVMTRLHAEVARSISFYRSQQEGSAPTQVLLTGGSTQLPYMQNFFEEKLQVQVEFLNPFTALPVPAHVDEEQLGHDAFTLPVLVGLALRRALRCPVEINLAPEELNARKIFRRRIPFLAIAAIGSIVIMGIWWAFVGSLRGLYEKQHERTQMRVDTVAEAQEVFDRANKTANDAKTRADAYAALLQRRKQWPEIMTSVDQAIHEPELWLTSLKATRADGQMQGVAISVSAWADLEGGLKAEGKTIVETVVDALAATPAFVDDAKQIKIDGQQAGDWMSSFQITARLTSAEQAKKEETSRRTSRRR